MNSIGTAAKMKDRASIYCVLAAIAVAAASTFNKTEPMEEEHPNVTMIAIKPIIFELAAIQDQPKSPIVNFYSYTYWNPTTPDLFPLDTKELRSRLRSSFFDAVRLTVFVADGSMKNGSSEMCTRLCEEYLKYNRANVIVVDWGGGRTFPTEESVATQVHAVAKKIATLVAKLVLFAHLDLDNTIFVGYSMGAHVMGAAGKILEGLVDTVVGLDPSVFTSQAVNDSEKLDRSSAQYVQVVHTNGGNLGLNEAIGDADFFANDGIDQPGCLGNNVCSHKRAWQYFAESINSVAGFYGTKFSSDKYFSDIQPNKKKASLPTCTSGTLAPMGGLKLDHKAQGIFMFQTVPESPFALAVQRPRFPKHRARSNRTTRFCRSIHDR